MKKSITLTLIMAVGAISLVAQTVVIKTLEDINSFNYDTVDNLYIQSTSDIDSVSGFETLKMIKNDLLIDTNSFTSITGFNNLEHINGKFRLEYNASLKTVNGFNKLKSIGKSFSIRINGVKEITGFSSLTDVHLITIEDSRLTNVDFLSHIKTAEAGLRILNNSQLLNLDGFSNLKRVKFLSFVNNKSLENLHGLSNITKSTDTDFKNNNSLIDLSGLESLDTIESNIFIGGNANLVSVDAIKNISFVRGVLAIWDNPNLSECSMISHLVTNPTIVQLEVSIYDNGPGCNYDDLYTDIPLTTEQNIAIYPNPSREKTIVDVGDNNFNYTLLIYNMYGSLVKSYQSINSPLTIEWNNNQKGIYYYQIRSEYREIQSGKIIVE